MVAMEAREFHTANQFALHDLKITLQTLKAVVAKSTQIIVIVFRKQGHALSQVGTMSRHEGTQCAKAVGVVRCFPTQGGFIRFVPQKIRTRLLALKKCHHSAFVGRMS